jgi:hypothetical protein
MDIAYFTGYMLNLESIHEVGMLIIQEYTIVNHSFLGRLRENGVP